MFVCVHVCGHDMLRMTPRVKDGVSCLGHTVTRCLFVYVCVCFHCLSVATLREGVEPLGRNPPPVRNHPLECAYAAPRIHVLV